MGQAPDVPVEAASTSAHAGTIAESDDRVEPERVLVAGQELWVFAESPPLISAMVRDIQGAKVRVWIECYIFLNDAAGYAIAQAIKERAGAGVDVRVLYDAVGSQATPAAFFDDMMQSGVKVHAYHTLWEAASHFSIFKFFRTMNRRDHRKLTVIDDNVAYFGGMNIVDQGDAATPDRARRLPASAGWRDVHVRLHGSQQAEIAQSFERSWRRAHGLKVKRRPRASRRELASTLADSTVRGSGDLIRFLEAVPHTRRRRLAAAFRALIGSAAQSVILSMAYFIPPGRVLGAIRRAAARHVRIRVVVPAKSDVKVVACATRHMYARLLKMGVEVFERQDRMLHSKVMVVDDLWVVVGSCNLDPRSLQINLEFIAIIRSAAMAEKVTAICNHEISSSRLVTREACMGRKWWQSLFDRIAYAFRRWL